VIDLHCHLLPGVDDGPATAEEAVALARGARDDGVETIAATPHVDWDHRELDAALISAGVDALQRRLDDERVGIRIVTGGEVELTRALDLDESRLRALTLGGGPWLLLECPLSPTLAPGFATGARALAARGYRLLLAHPERSPVFLRAPDLLAELVAEGMLAQVTAASLTGRFGRSVRDLARRLVADGTVHVAASDGHNAARPATIARELRAAGLDARLAQWLAYQVPAAVLGGEPVPERPSGAIPRRRRLGRLLVR
jgi:protein-tyrosine phosphatase